MSRDVAPPTTGRHVQKAGCCTGCGHDKHGSTCADRIRLAPNLDGPCPCRIASRADVA